MDFGFLLKFFFFLIQIFMNTKYIYEDKLITFFASKLEYTH